MNNLKTILSEAPRAKALSFLQRKGLYASIHPGLKSPRFSRSSNKSLLTHLLLILLIILCTTIAWHGILNQIIEGEGYYYFSPTNSFIYPSGKSAFELTRFDNFPRLSTYLLEQVYGGDIQPYMTFQFIVIIFINITIYLTLYGITKNKTLALITALYFGINYSGNFQLYARGHFQWFTQRVVEFIPILGAIYFIWKFTKLKHFRDYLISYCLFFLALTMTHYTIMFLSFFPAILLVTSIIHKSPKLHRFSLIFLCVPFIITTYLIVGNSTLGLDVIHPKQSLWESILQTKDTFHKLSFQLTVVTFPFSLVKLISTLTKQHLIQIETALIIPTYIFYLLSGIYLYRKRLPYFNLIIGSFVALIGVLYLNVYVNRVNVFNEIEQGRYLYIPGLYVGIMLSTLISTFVIHQHKQSWKTFIAIILVLLWIIPNIYFIWDKVNSSQRYYTGGRAMLKYLAQTKNKLPYNSVILLPNPLMPLGIDFLKKYYNSGDTTFIYNDINWKNKIPATTDINKLYVFDYNEEYYRGSQARLQYISIVDKSASYRQMIFKP